MTPARRAARIVSVVVLTVPALSGCGVRGDQNDAAASSATSSASPTSAMSSIDLFPAPSSSTASPPGENVPPAAPPGEKLSPADLPAVVADRTYRGDFDGQSFAEYYLPDGTLHGRAGDQTYTGSWEVLGEQLCLTYPAEGMDSEVSCYSVFRDGDTLSWLGDDGTVLQPAYVEGNPDNL